MKRASLILAAFLATAAAPALAAGNTDPDRLERWQDLTALIFGDDAKIAPTDSLVTIDAPERALELVARPGRDRDRRPATSPALA